MTYYAFIQDDKINGCGECRQLTQGVVNYEITEEIFNNIDKYVWNGEAVVLDPDYEQKQADEREANFKAEFFQVGNFGFYRKKPKGYTSALESLSVAYNMITSGAIQQLPAGTFIFYPEPDYTKPEECTEEWLVAHHILSEAMTAQQFVQFYAAFVTAWNTEMH